MAEDTNEVHQKWIDGVSTLAKSGFTLNAGLLVAIPTYVNFSKIAPGHQQWVVAVVAANVAGIVCAIESLLVLFARLSGTEKLFNRTYIVARNFAMYSMATGGFALVMSTYHVLSAIEIYPWTFWILFVVLLISPVLHSLVGIIREK